MQRIGKKPFHHRAWHAAHPLIVLTTVFALVIAPLVVILTHGPGVDVVSTSILADIAEHGHAHDSAGDENHDGPLSCHNPADHDHQLHALMCQQASAAKPLPDKARCALSEAYRNLTPEGPIRPPRFV